MKFLSLILVLALAFLSLTCKNQSSNPITQVPVKQGNVHLSFAHAPAGISQVVAHLTRNGFSERILSLTIADSTNSASGSISDLEIGMWHLRVDALDDTGHVKYTGQTDVEIFPDQTTRVTLQLHGTGGSLDILVTWGSGSCTPVPDGLVSWWKGEENGLDVMGLNNGTIINGVSFAAGEVGGAFVFDGTSQYVRIPNSPSISLSGSFTFEAWIFPRYDAQGVIISKWGWHYEWNEQRSYAFNIWTGRRLDFSVTDVMHQDDPLFHRFETDSGTIPMNAWSHVAATYDQNTGTRSLYINGALSAQRIQTPFILQQTIADVTIGGWLPSPSEAPRQFFPGMIDELSVYNRALSQAEIQAIYSAGAAGKCN